MKSIKYGVSALFVMASASIAQAGPHERAIRLFDRIAGVPIQLNDPRLAQMEALIARGDLQGAAEIATDDDNFYNLTLVHMASQFTNPAHDPVVPLSDVTASIVGMVRDGRDMRELLTGNYIYIADPTRVPMVGNTNIQTDQAIYRSNQHYQSLETGRINLRQNLVQAPQRLFNSNNNNGTLMDNPDPGGILTMRAWGQSYLDAGTNRRAFMGSMDQLLCSQLAQLRDASKPVDRIRRDVDRVPGGNVQTFMSTCRSCHSGMDGMTGAFAYLDWQANNGGFLFYTPATVRGKYNINTNIYPQGYITRDDSWLNYWVDGQNANLGWSSSVPTSGNGINSFGTMLANTRAFASCMVKRVWAETCRRPAQAADNNIIASITDDFVASGYKLKRAFEKVSVQNTCLGSN